MRLISKVVLETSGILDMCYILPIGRSLHLPNRVCLFSLYLRILCSSMLVCVRFEIG